MNDSLSWKFFNYIIWDCIIILLIIFNQYFLITQGLWKFIESDIESMENAYDRVFLANSDEYKNDLNPNDFIFKAKSLHKDKTRISKDIKEEGDSKKYYDYLFPKIRVIIILC